MESACCQPSGTQNLEVDPRFLKNLWASALWKIGLRGAVAVMGCYTARVSSLLPMVRDNLAVYFVGRAISEDGRP
jgi:hypothetical protein